MKRRIALALGAVAALACGAEAPGRESTPSPMTASVEPASAHALIAMLDRIRATGVKTGLIGQALDSAAVSVHDVDFRVAVTVRRKNDPALIALRENVSRQSGNQTGY